MELLAGKGRLYATPQKRRTIELPEDFDEAGDTAGPTCLMAGADPRAVVTMEILVEQEIVPPVRVALEFPATAEHRAPSTIGQKDACQPIGDLSGNLE